MPKVEKKDFMKRLNESGLEDTLLISLMEDLEDSWKEDDTELKTQNENLQNEINDLKEKYKQRFLDGGNGNMKPIENNTKENEPREPRKFEDLFDEKGELK